MADPTRTPVPDSASSQALTQAVVVLLHSLLARELGPDGVAPDWWGDEEFRAFLTLRAAVSR